MSHAASAFSSRNAVSGSTSRSIRSRAVSFPRERCRSTAASPPPSATEADRSRSSATSPDIRSWRRENSSERSTCEVRTATVSRLSRAMTGHPAPSARTVVAVAATVVAGIVLRVWVYRSAAGAPDSDEAIVGLMPRHILHGEFTVFFWGQVYGGSQEALLAAPLTAILGSSLLAVRLVPIALAAVA